MVFHCRGNGSCGEFPRGTFKNSNAFSYGLGSKCLDLLSSCQKTIYLFGVQPSMAALPSGVTGRIHLPL